MLVMFCVVLFVFFSVLLFAFLMFFFFISFICIILCFFFFFKQKTAYDLRISDWSSDVCSSDLQPEGPLVTVDRWRHLVCSIESRKIVNRKTRSQTACAYQYSDASAPIFSIINDSFDPVVVRGLKQAEVVHNLAFARRRPDLRLYLLQCRSSCQKQQLIHGNRKLYGARCRSIIRCTTHKDQA